MKSAPSPRAPRGLCAWSATTAARALNAFGVFVSAGHCLEGSARNTYIAQNLDHLLLLEQLQDARSEIVEVGSKRAEMDGPRIGFEGIENARGEGGGVVQGNERCACAHILAAKMLVRWVST